MKNKASANTKEENKKEIKEIKKTENEDKDYSGEIKIEIVELADMSEKDSQKKKKKKIKNIIFDVVRYAVMIVALCLFSYASYELTLIYINAQETKESAGQIEDLFLVDVDKIDKEYVNSLGEVIEFSNTGDGKAFVWNFEEIKQYNPYAKGYIRQTTGPYIDNPIVQHPSNNDYYLKHRSDNSQSKVGAIFIDYRIKEGLHSKNCVIYGHNLGPWLDCIMFGSLKFYYTDKSYGMANPTMDIYIDNKHYVYYVYSVFKVPETGSGVYRWDFADDAAFMQYVEKFKSQTIYKFPKAPEVTKDSHIITLSTCTTEKTNRLIVQLVRGEEVFDVPVK